MTISPSSPGPSSAPAAFITETSGPAAIPTVPGLRGAGGSGLQVIWCAASVMAYASTTGAAKVASSSPMTRAGRAADEERMKRSRRASTTSRFRGARARIVWCMVGTAEYQVGFASASQPKTLSALKPGAQYTLPPEWSVASTQAMRPWM